MTVDLIARLRRLEAAATPGPWRWEMNLKSRIVEICGGPAKGGFGRFDLSVLSFVRWGMNSAAPKFWKWSSEGGWIGKPQRADELAKPAPGREHHATWFAEIDHPDARIMVEARNALPTLLDALEQSLKREKALRDAIANVLPVGDNRAPGDRVFPFYIRMDELRALRSLLTTPSPEA